MKLPVHLEHEGLVSHRLGPGRNRLQIRSVATVRWRGVAVLHGFVAIRIFRHKRKSEVNRRSSLLAALNHKMEMNIWTASPTRLKSRSRPIFDYRKVTTSELRISAPIERLCQGNASWTRSFRTESCSCNFNLTNAAYTSTSKSRLARRTHQDVKRRSAYCKLYRLPNSPAALTLDNNKHPLTTISTHQGDRTLSLCDDVRSKQL
jgi:hypothetical protein